MIRTTLLIILAFGVGILVPIVNPNILPDHHSSEEDSTTHEDHEEESHASANSMKHDPIEVDPSLPIPSVTLNVQKDAMAWYNAFIRLENFVFIPEKASSTWPIENEWHAHLYVNEVKVGRVYGTAYHIPDSYFTLGAKNQVKVTLNAHNHSDRTKWWTPIQSTVDVLHESNEHMH